MSPTDLLCVIPARGGSKRVPRKNARLIAGVPMIQRAIRIVQESCVASAIVVSTDDEEIANLASNAGADVPFRRPSHLADDHTPTAPVISHAAEQYALLGELPPTLLVVYPTAILTAPDDLVAARDLLLTNDSDVVMSVCAHRAPIERAWRLMPDGRAEMLHPDLALARTQDLEPAYYDAGQFYMATTEFWLRGGDLAAGRPALFPLPPWRAIDIDTEADLEFAERLIRH